MYVSSERELRNTDSDTVAICEPPVCMARIPFMHAVTTWHAEEAPGVSHGA